MLLDDIELERSELERLMDTLPAGVFVCASQTRRLWGEGHAIELPGLDADAAVALIERERGRMLDLTERATAERLGARLHGQPLAILEAAAEVDGAPPAGAPAVPTVTSDGRAPGSRRCWARRSRPASTAAMADDGRVHIDVALERGEGTIRGTFDDGNGPVVEFSGWLELMSALDTVRAGASAPGRAPGSSGKSDGP